MGDGDKKEFLRRDIFEGVLYLPTEFNYDFSSQVIGMVDLKNSPSNFPRVPLVYLWREADLVNQVFSGYQSADDPGQLRSVYSKILLGVPEDLVIPKEESESAGLDFLLFRNSFEKIRSGFPSLEKKSDVLTRRMLLVVMMEDLVRRKKWSKDGIGLKDNFLGFYEKRFQTP